MTGWLVIYHFLFVQPHYPPYCISFGGNTALFCISLALKPLKPGVLEGPFSELQDPKQWFSLGFAHPGAI